ncbi:MAG: transporter substrate-binding domain-containing protein [Ruminiclostridium sp.]|nr:transporter substrate-binding domain-containing protein [Ruminiclostridium sp.]
MKKKYLALFLAAALGCSLLAGCGGTSDEAEGGEETTELVYAVEAGSAGEAAAAEQGWSVNAVASQADALMEVASGTSDAAIIDLLMAGAMIGEGTSYPNLTYTDKLTTEEYGAGCRQGSDLADFINYVFADTYSTGELQEIATTYGVQEALCEQDTEGMGDFIFSEDADSDIAYIREKGTLIVGITDFAPMDYKDETGNWIGFDADMAKLVAEKLGVQVQFVEIDWDNKIMELDSKNIDVVWNGMTLTNEVLGAMTCTVAYCNNAQVVVVPAE